MAYDRGTGISATTTPSDIAKVLEFKDEIVAVAAIDDEVAAVANNNADVTTVANNLNGSNTIGIVAGEINNVENVGANIAAVIAVDSNETNINTVAADLTGVDNIGTVATNITNVNNVGGNISAVIAVDANETNINAIAADLAGANTIGAVGAIATEVATVAGIASDVTAVAGDAADIGTVSANIVDVNTVADISGNVTTVAGISGNVTSVAGNSANINTVAGIAGNVNTVAGISTNVTSVAGNATNINTVAGNTTNINAVAGNSTNINAVNANKTNIDTVATNITNVNNVGGNIANVNTVAGNTTNINAVAGNSTNINTVATNNTNINTVAGINTEVSAVAAIDTEIEALYAQLPTIAQKVSKPDTTPVTNEAVALFDGTDGLKIKAGGTLGTAAFTASTAYATAAQGTNADTAFGWGDHAAEGYLTDIKTVNGNSLVGTGNVDVGTVTSVATNNGLTGGTITSSGTIGLTGQALALHNLATNGLIARTGAGTVAGRTITASTGISVTNGNGVSGNPTITNTAPDQTVVLTSGTGISASGTYPNFTITNTAPDQTVSLTGSGATSITGTYPNFTISSTDTNTTYSAGTGLSLVGTTFSNTDLGSSQNIFKNVAVSGQSNIVADSNNDTLTVAAGTGVSLTTNATTDTLTITNTAPDQTVVLTAGTGISTSGTYPNFTITNTAPYSNADVDLHLNTSTASTGEVLSWNGTDYDWTPAGVGTVTSVSGNGTVNGISLSGTVTSSGNLTLGGTLSGVDLTTQVAGTLPIANGGTGATSSSNARVNLLPSYAGNGGKVLTVNTGATDVEWSPVPPGYTNSDVDAHLNVSTAGTGEVLSWNGTDYDWIPGGGVTSITGTANQITASASTGAVTLSLPSTINVDTSGNAATATSATSATYLNSSNYIQRTGSSGNANTDFSNTPAGTYRYYGDNASVTNGPENTWWFYQTMRHSNGTNLWGTQVAWGWEDNANRLATRNVSGGTYGPWVYYYNSANPPPTSVVLSATAGANYNAVGTYAWLYRGLSTAIFAEGSTYAGSTLFPYGMLDNTAFGVDTIEAVSFTRGGTAVSGTWRCMSRSGAAGNYSRAGVFLRIA